MATSGTAKTDTVMNDRDRTYLQTPEQWTRFLSAFVHELQTPLASFRMLADLLAEAPQGHLGAQERRYSENIREVTIAIVREAARRNVKVLELRYSPIIHTFAGITIRQAIRAVLSGMNQARERDAIHVGLIEKGQYDQAIRSALAR